MINHENKRPVTLEDLLRLKRAERPSAEFWNRFDRDLRAKQLAAIVENRPWWHVFSRAFARLSRYHVPLGATAILALTMISVREFRTVAPGQVSEKFSSSTPVASMPESAPLVANEGGSAAGEVVAVASNAGAEMPAELTLNSDPAVATVSAEGASLAPASPGAETTSLSPSTRSIAGNLAAAQSAELSATRDLFGAARGFEARAMPAHTPKLDPLAQMTSPADARRSRLLNAASLTAASFAPATHTGERVARRISDDRLYDNIAGRFGASGDSVSLKF